MKKLFSAIFLALFFLTAAQVMPAIAGTPESGVVDDKKKDDKKKDPPGPVVVKEKDSPKGGDKEKDKKGKKPV